MHADFRPAEQSRIRTAGEERAYAPLMSAEVVVAVAELAAVVVGVGALWVTLGGIKNQLWILTFTEYTKRYSEAMTAMPAGVRRRENAVDIDALPEQERERLLACFRNYFNLCSEEYYLFKNKKIDAATWSIWEDGMESVVCCPSFRQGWSALREEYESFPQFRTHFDNLVARATCPRAPR